MMGGSFAVSLLIHAILLLIIGSIVIVPAAVEKFLPVTSVAPPPMEIPEPPPMEASASEPLEEESGSPISDVKEVLQSEQPTSDLEALVVETPNSQAPSLNASSGGASVSGDVFSHLGAGGQGGSGGGKGASGSGTARKTVFFGTTAPTKGLLVGTFYDPSRTRDGKDVGLNSPGITANAATAFVEGHGAVSAFKNCWKSKEALYATTLTFPACGIADVFEAFGEKVGSTKPTFLLHYTGYIATPVDMTFRFNGLGDDLVFVLVDGKLVLALENSGAVGKEDGQRVEVNWQTNTARRVKGYKWMGWQPSDDLISITADEKTPGYDRYTCGTWMSWKANEYHKIDLLIGEPTGGFAAWFFVEQKDRSYKKLPTGIPILPLFRVGHREKLDPKITSHYTFGLMGVDEKQALVFLCK